MVRDLLQRAIQRLERAVYGGDSLAAWLPPPEAPIAEAPIPAAWIREGAPVARAQLLTRSRDGGFATGVWECSPGRFRWYFACDEVVVVLAGTGRVRVGDAEHTLAPGATVFFPVGTESEWEIHTPLRKHFTHRAPASLMRKLVGAA
jgi:uncharacterized protein